MALTTKGKKSSLKEDALIYEKRKDDATGKQRWSSLSGKQKRTQFKEYYLMPLVVALIAVGLVVFFIYHDFIAKEDIIYQCDIVNETHSADSLKSFSEGFVAFEKLDTEENDASFQTFYLDSELASAIGATVANDMQMISAHIYASSLDSMITDENVFTSYYGNNIYLDLDEFLTKEEKDALKDYLYIPNDKKMNPNQKAYGIYLDQSSTYQGMFEKDQIHRVEKPILSILANSKRLETTHELLRYLFPEVLK